MSLLEVRRHSVRKAGAGSQLSQEGVELARTLGTASGPFKLVTTSVSPRARETAIAMGFAVDHELVTLTMNSRVYEEAVRIRWWEEEYPFASLAQALALDTAYTRHANAIAGIWRDLLTPLGDDDSVLLIGHSGELEPALVACFPDADHRSWGTTFGPCEGARLSFDGEPAHFAKIEILRLPRVEGIQEPLESDQERLLGL